AVRVSERVRVGGQDHPPAEDWTPPTDGEPRRGARVLLHWPAAVGFRSHRRRLLRSPALAECRLGVLEPRGDGLGDSYRRAGWQRAVSRPIQQRLPFLPGPGGHVPVQPYLVVDRPVPAAGRL